MNRNEHDQEMRASDHRAESERQYYKDNPKPFWDNLKEVCDLMTEWNREREKRMPF